MFTSFVTPVVFAVLGGVLALVAKNNVRHAAAIAVLGALTVSVGLVGFSLVQAAATEQQRDAAEWTRGYARCSAQANYTAVTKCRCLFEADGMKGPDRLGYRRDLRAKC